MWVTRTIKEVRKIVEKERARGKVIGLVPTMGYLHEGHLSLIDVAKERSDYVVVSLFVNPTQFGPGEDLERYPKDFNHDRELAEGRGADLLFAPSVEEIYPREPYLELGMKRLTDHLCGRRRPGHFSGVMLVVTKLFNIIRPDVAVFGQKDAQQLFVIKRLVEELNFPIEIIAAPTVREADGFAISSRNIYLNEKQRAQSTILYESLQAAKELIQSGERDAEKVIEKVRGLINSADEAKIDYIEIVDTDDLQPITEIEGTSCSSSCSSFMIALAVYFGRARLIDNIILEKRDGELLRAI